VEIEAPIWLYNRISVEASKRVKKLPKTKEREKFSFLLNESIVWIPKMVINTVAKTTKKVVSSVVEMPLPNPFYCHHEKSKIKNLQKNKFRS